MHLFKILLIITFFILFMGCFTSGKMDSAQIPVVQNFNLSSYLGKWYEIARLPNRFEKGLDFVTAEYSLKENGMVKVVNRGYKTQVGEWKQAVGKAKIPNPELPAHLKVSFFWIFYADYKVIALDQENYSYALVTSSSKEYLWILSRTLQLENDIYEKLVNIAKDYGFDTDKLYRVQQEGLK